MTTIYTLAIITIVITMIAYSVSTKWGLIVSGVLIVLAIVICALQYFGWRW